MGVKIGWIQIKMSHPLAQNGAALAPFRANGAHPSYAVLHTKFLVADSLCCTIVYSGSNVKLFCAQPKSRCLSLSLQVTRVSISAAME